jgi:NAD+ kinase
MGSVWLVYQPAVEGSRELAERCAVLVEKCGLEPNLISSWDFDNSPPEPRGDFAITFGGDGTILRVARWGAGSTIRIIGVQMGRLGFLAELQPAELLGRIESYLQGDFWEDERAMLGGDVVEADLPVEGREAQRSVTPPRQSFIALNDIVVGRGAAIRTVSVEISINGHTLHEFRCDGVIVATATGSTAYSFACGGPVLPPDSRELVITPISPHLSTLKSFVISETAPIRLRVSSTDPATLTVDGQDDESLGLVGVVEARVAQPVTRFARQGSEVELYRRNLAKLG